MNCKYLNIKPQDLYLAQKKSLNVDGQVAVGDSCLKVGPKPEKSGNGFPFPG